MTDVHINGCWQVGEGQSFESINPASGDVVWQGHATSERQVGLAVAAARESFQSWQLTSVETRADILKKYTEQITDKKEALALAISTDMGKPMWEARTEAGAMAAKIDHSIRAYQERTGDKEGDGFKLTHRPHGVMAVFGPFNFPGHLPNGHIVPSLLAGNTVVFKPSELTPQIASIMLDCFKRAGLPDGVLNIVQGGRETGGALLAAEIDGLLFTGSAATGTAFHKYFAGRPEIMLALEMGGNNPLIIREPVDVMAAADIAFMSGFITTGQRCSCTRRLILPKGSFGDEVIEALMAKMSRITIGSGDEDVFIGPLVSARAAEQAVDFQDNLVKAGGKIITPLERFGKTGAFVSPGLIDVTNTNVPDEELFGPLLQVIRTDSLEESFARANDTRFGLAGGLVCDDLDVWVKAQQHMRAGILNWNKPTTGAASSLPFGGPGVSGNHRPSAYYAADYCAWPVASQLSPKAAPLDMNGMT